MTPKRTEQPARHARRSDDPYRVAVCIDSRDGPGRERLQGVYRYALERSWRLFLVRNDDRNALQQLASLRLDGAILYDRVPALHQFLKRLGVICVEAGARNLDLDDAAVFSDSVAITRQAAEHLVAAGLKHFGYCSLAKRHPSTLRAKYLEASLKGLGFALEVFLEKLPDGEAHLAPLIRW